MRGSAASITGGRLCEPSSNTANSTASAAAGTRARARGDSDANIAGTGSLSGARNEQRYGAVVAILERSGW